MDCKTVWKLRYPLRLGLLVGSAHRHFPICSATTTIKLYKPNNSNSTMRQVIRFVLAAFIATNCITTTTGSRALRALGIDDDPTPCPASMSGSAASSMQDIDFSTNDCGKPFEDIPEECPEEPEYTTVAVLGAPTYCIRGTPCGRNGGSTCPGPRNDGELLYGATCEILEGTGGARGCIKKTKCSASDDSQSGSGSLTSDSSGDPSSTPNYDDGHDTISSMSLSSPSMTASDGNNESNEDIEEPLEIDCSGSDADTSMSEVSAESTEQDGKSDEASESRSVSQTGDEVTLTDDSASCSQVEDEDDGKPDAGDVSDKVDHTHEPHEVE